MSLQFYSGDIVRVIKWHPDGTSEKLSLSVILDSIPDLGIQRRRWKRYRNVAILSADGEGIKSRREN